MQVMPFWVRADRQRATTTSSTSAPTCATAARSCATTSTASAATCPTALARYNGSLGRGEYPNAVLAAMRTATRRWLAASGAAVKLSAIHVEAEHAVRAPRAAASHRRPPARCISARWSRRSRATPTHATSGGDGGCASTTSTSRARATTLPATSWRRSARSRLPLGRRRRSPDADASARYDDGVRHAARAPAACSPVRARAPSSRRRRSASPASASIRERAATACWTQRWRPMRTGIAWRLRVDDAAIEFTDRVQGLQRQIAGAGRRRFRRPAQRRPLRVSARRRRRRRRRCDHRRRPRRRPARIDAAADPAAAPAGPADADVPARAGRDQRARRQAVEADTGARDRRRSAGGAWRRVAVLDQPMAATAPASPAEFWQHAIRAWSPSRIPPVNMLPCPPDLS